MKTRTTTLRLILAGSVAALLNTQSLHAATLTWDLTSGDGATITPGTGAWNTTAGNLVWNNAGANPNVIWSQTSGTSATNSAVFAGADGTAESYVVTLGTAIAASALTFNNTGYKITGNTLTTGVITVAANKTATINSILSIANATTNNINGTLNLTGGDTLSTNVLWNSTGTVNLSAGTYAMSNTRFDLPVWNQTGGTVNLASTGPSGSWIGYQNTVRNVSMTVSGGTFNVTGAIASGAYLGVGRLWSGGTATLTVKTGGTVNFGSATTDGTLALNQDGTADTAKLDVQGGTFNVFNASAGSSLTFFPGAANAGKTAIMTQSGGTSTINGIVFGAATGTPVYDPTSRATLQLSGGNLYVGVNGITRGAVASALPVTIQLQGGILGASDTWSSSLNMALGTTGGGPTIQTATAASVSKNITLSGILSDDTAVQGTLTKTGAGTLTLSGANTYSGATTVNAGTLALNYSTQNNSKLSDSAALVLGGGTVDLSGGTHTEIVASTSLTARTASRVTQSTGASVLQMGTITPGAGASIDFGASNIATTSNINNNGILGTWATVGGTDWATNSGLSGGLITAVTYDADVPRLTPGSIANGPATNIRIVEGSGSAGSITLGAATTTINTLNQSASGGGSAATIDPAGQTLATNSILMGNAAGGLTIGTGTNNGTLTAATPGGDLTLINNTGNGLTINSVIADNSASTLTKLGTGPLTLTGVNTYSGATTIYGGTLNANSTDALGNGSATNTLIFIGGTLQAGGTITSPATRLVTLTSTTQIDTNNNPVSIAGIVSGAGGLTKIGLGTLTLSGNNTYGGTTTVNAGTLAIGSGGVIGTSSSAITVSGATSALSIGNGGIVNASGVMDLNGGGTIYLENGGALNATAVSTVNNGGVCFTLANASPGKLTSSGAAGTGGTMTVTGSGTYYLRPLNYNNNNHLFTFDNVNVNASGAIFEVGRGGSFDTMTLSNGANVNVKNVAVSTDAGDYVLNVNSGSSLTLANNTFTLYQGSAGDKIVTVNVNAGTISGISSLSFGGALSSSVNISNGGVIQATTVAVNNSATNTLSFDNGTLKAVASTATFLSGTGTVKIKSGGATIDSGSFTVTASSALTEDGTSTGGGLTKIGTGTLTLSVNNSYTGATNVNNGTLAISGGGTLGNGSATNNLNMGGGTLDLGATSQTVGAVSVNAPASSGNTIQNGSLTGTSYAASNTIGNAVISANLLVNASAGFSKSGVGTATLVGANTYSGGTTVSAGTVVAGVSNASTVSGAFGPSASGVTLGDASTSTNGSSPSVLIGGAFTVSNPIAVANRATSGTYTIGGNTASSSTFSGAITLNQPLTVSQQVAGGTVNITGGISTGGSDTALTVSGAGNVTIASSVVLGTTGELLNTITGTLNINSGTQTYKTLQIAATSGTTNVNTALDSGTIVNANATTNFTTSQTLNALNIGGTGMLVGLSEASDVTSGLSVVAAPEPGSLGLLLVGALGIAARRRRRA